MSCRSSALWKLAVIGAAASLATLDCAHAGIVVQTDRYSYSGTVTRYDSLTDAVGGSNPGTTYAIPSRDVGIRFRQNSTGLAPSGSSDSAFYFVPNWQGVSQFNQNFGFVQIADINGATIQTGDALFNPTGDTFAVLATGGGAGPTTQFARLGHDPAMNALPGVVTQGVFHQYALDGVFLGLTNYNTSNFSLQGGDTQIIEKAVNGPSANVVGTLRAVFENTNPLDASYHGFYGIDLTLSNVSVGFSNFGLSGDDTEGLFAVSTTLSAVPEPSSLILTGLIAAGALAYGRRARRKAS